ncbi:hypothetical protein [Novosphingobium humi]|uniref:Uncharacterized protein n=1 Tax=Novosphingobium humi TaxID=2282397 RepID=A0ABY7TTX0_9SPHN|nr:hypothetical protein [Novosphingobium humi]WCT76061.1 hypothetical protein PQ457_08850 [Novosphingobium humi]WJS97476.1 hypothetical protein NYQ05_09885 [Novosphingobium humi]
MTLCRLIAIALIPLLATPRTVQAQTATPTPKPPPPITRAAPSVEDVATTPLSDLNIRKKGVPDILIRAQAAPYGLTGMGRCSAIQKEVSKLNAVLGEDVDAARRSGRKVIPGKVAQDLVGGILPFRGIVREISGANAENRALQQAIYAGFARRAFLKGVGLQKRCGYPARPG